jgi:hypothetical protein
MKKNKGLLLNLGLVEFSYVIIIFLSCFKLSITDKGIYLFSFFVFMHLVRTKNLMIKQ